METKKLIDLILDTGMTLSEIGRRIGAPHCTVSRWYNGHNEPMNIYREQLANLLEEITK